MLITGITFGPKSTHRVLPVADLAYGPCESGESAFCEGRGSEVIDPRAMADPDTAFRTAIMCSTCRETTEIRAGFEWA